MNSPVFLFINSKILFFVKSKVSEFVLISSKEQSIKLFSFASFQTEIFSSVASITNALLPSFKKWDSKNW